MWGELKRERNSCLLLWRRFWAEYHRLAWCLGFVILIVYGGRIVHDDFFLDSEVMIAQPDVMRYVWLGNNRPGMVATGLLFGLYRLSPWLSNSLMGMAMWFSGLLLSFCAYVWTKESRRYRWFLYCFPILFLTAPVFVEQYLFVLQSFEISVGILLTLAAVFCSDRFCVEREKWCGIFGLFFLVWALGTYQSFAPMYLSLVLTAFVLRYLNGEAEHALRYGLVQAVFFVVACGLYMAVVFAVRWACGTDSTYVADMVRWRTDGVYAAVVAIRETILRVFLGVQVFYRRYYLPAAGLCILQALLYGWKKKTGIGNFGWFLLGGFLLFLSPFYMTMVAGALQPIRTQMVYPVVSALFLAHLTVLPENGGGGQKENCNTFCAAQPVLCGAAGS